MEPDLAAFNSYKIDVAFAGMIAGGTGITPMYQVAKCLLGDPQEYTCLSLIYANISEDDILMRKELDELTNTNSRSSTFETEHALSSFKNYINRQC